MKKKFTDDEVRQRRKACTSRWKKNNREKVNSRHREWLKNNPGYKRNRRMKIIEMVNGLKNAPCMDCGNTFHPVAMDFDHVRGSKKMSISAMVNSQDARLQDILDEILKCDLVCANCHRVRGFKRGDFGNNHGKRKDVIECRHHRQGES